MLLEKPANRIQAYLLEKFAGYGVVTCTGLCLPYTPKESAETTIYEYGVSGDKVTLNDRVDVQFILLGEGGSYEERAQSRGRGTDYDRIGRLILLIYTASNDAVDAVEPALSQLSGITLRRFDIKPQVVAAFLRYQGDFNFQRPLAAFELEITERVLRQNCTDLPTDLCPKVSILDTGTDTVIAEVAAGGTYPVLVLTEIRNTLTSTTTIVNTL